MKEYIYVLNYNDGKIYRIDVDDEDEDETTEDILNNHGFNIDEVEYMYSTVETDCIIKAKKEYEDS